MRWALSSCSNVSCIPRAFAPPQPKQILAGLGLRSISTKSERPLRAIRFGRRVGAYAFQASKARQASAGRERCVFRPGLQIQAAKYWAADSANKNNGRGQRPLHAREGE